jgi:poly-gamma-glutamate synthesis protein (capsule biosynthesis protein)
MKNEKRINIGLMGDVMLGRIVSEELKRQDFRYPWGNVIAHLKSMNMNLINLETTFTRSKHAVSKVFNFKSEPVNVQSLKEANITVANLANNHILDFSEEGMEDTIRFLNKEGIKHVGAGKGIEEAMRPVVIACGDLRIGILGCTDNEPGWAADGKPGINYVDIENKRQRAQIVRAIKDLKAVCDLCIVSIHWGPNMLERPSADFISFGHEMIDGGADVIHGHSAHIFQGIEIYKSKIVLYDTGDFIDDYRVDTTLRNDRSFLFVLHVSEKKSLGLTMMPVLISDCQVNFAEDKDHKWCIRRMQNLSEELGTRINGDGEVLFPDN